MLAGSGLLPATRSIIAAISRSPEPVEGERSDVGSSDPRRLESGRYVMISSTPKRFDPVHCPTEHFKARRINPMHVLKDHQHRMLARLMTSIVR